MADDRENENSSRENDASDYINDTEMVHEAIRGSAEQVIELFIPVTLCMIIVVASIQTDPSYSHQEVMALSPHIFGSDLAQKTDTASTLWRSLSYALMILGVVIIVSVAFVVLYYYRFYKILRGFLVLCSVIILFYFSFNFLMDVLTIYNTAFDFITLSVVMWNYGIVGIVVIHFSGPIRLQQAYLIVNSALLALNFIKLLPEWSIWLLLALMAVWDLIAVLCPMGPLRILVETARSRQEPLFPSLVYSSRMIWYVGVQDSQPTESKKENSVQVPSSEDGFSKNTSPHSDEAKVETESSDEIGDNVPQKNEAEIMEIDAEERQEQEIDDTLTREASGQVETVVQPPARAVEELIRREEAGVKLGLGDFVFYSLLVGKASVASDWNTTIACFIAILVGLSLTLLLLFIVRKALPALPISIACGLFFYFVTSLLVYDFVNHCQLRQVYI